MPDKQGSGMSVFHFRHHWRVFVVIAALFFIYASVLLRLSNTWWTDANYSHGLLLPFVIAYILWSQRQKLTESPSNPSTFWGSLAIGVALFALWVGVAGAELYVQRLSLLLMIGGVIVYWRGFHLLRLMWMPLGLLLLAIPIPAILFNQVAFPLQLFASQCAVWSMQALDIPVVRQGNVIELMPLNSLQTRKLEVVEACSGIRSLLTLLTLGAVLAYLTAPRARANLASGWRPVTSWGGCRFALVLFAAVPIAIVTNALRVSGTGILAHYFGTRIADGFFHAFSGWLIYVAALVLLFCFTWLLDRSASLASQWSAQDGAETVKRSAPQIQPLEGTDEPGLTLLDSAGRAG